MLQDDKRELLVKEYEKTRDAKKIASAYGVSVSTVYRLAKQKATTGTVKLQVSRRGRKRVLSEEDLIRIEDMIQENPGITLREIVEDTDESSQARISAARSVLEYGIKLTETTDILSRLDELEQLAEGKR